MKRIVVILLGLMVLGAGTAATAQDRDGPRHGGGMPEGRRYEPDIRRDGPMRPGPDPIRPGPYGVRPGPDSLGADWGPQQDQAFEGVRQRRYIPLGRAIEAIRRRTPGDQLDAGLEQWAGRPAYRVRWATPDGRRIDYMVDAETGAILGSPGR